MNYIAECLERAEKATEGPWTTWTESGMEGHFIIIIIIIVPHLGIEKQGDSRYPVQTESRENSEFIAHARQDVPELARRLKYICEHLREAAKVQHGMNSPMGELGEYWNRLADELEAPLEGE
jgi:hypothetical protein